MPELDKLDLELLEGAANGMTPVWAICRGMQIVNVFQGGSLWQDLPTQFNGVIDHSPEVPHDAVVHAIEAVSESDSFADFLSSKDLQVNSRHHQAVKDLGENVQVLAKSPDGVVEVLALESETWWVKGVQWHPENLMDLEIQRALWNEFLEATTQAKVETNRHSPSGGSHHHE